MNVYDFDNTIYKGDSTADFYLFSLRKHPSIIKFLPSLIRAYSRFYLFKKGTKTEMKEVMYRFLTKINPETDIKDFWDTHEKKIKSWYLKQQKDDDIIISASPEFLLEPICERLGIMNLIASKVDINTGKYSGINCHGKEKVRLFHNNYNGEIDEFYSDSYSDSPLAEISKKAFMVKGGKIEDWIKRTN